MRFEIFGTRAQATGIELQTTDYRLSRGFFIYDIRGTIVRCMMNDILVIPVFIAPTSDYRLPTTNYLLPTFSPGLFIYDLCVVYNFFDYELPPENFKLFLRSSCLYYCFV